MAIPDADYIREEEQTGNPTYRSIDAFRWVIINLENAEIYIKKAIQCIDDAWSEAEKHGKETLIEALGERMDDIRPEISKLIDKFKQGGNQE